jgi:hypothetical protein
MLSWLIGIRIRAFERSFNYDMSHARRILAGSRRAFFLFQRLRALARYCEGVPVEVACAAGLAATIAEDCGPCTQLGVTMAEREGISPQILRDIISHNIHALPADVVLGLQFGEAVVRRDPEAQKLRDQIVDRWGDRGLVSLAFAITSGRIFPTLKYALGYGGACTPIDVAGVATPVARRVSKAIQV